MTKTTMNEKQEVCMVLHEKINAKLVAKEFVKDRQVPVPNLDKVDVEQLRQLKVDPFTLDLFATLVKTEQPSSELDALSLYPKDIVNVLLPHVKHAKKVKRNGVSVLVTLKDNTRVLLTRCRLGSFLGKDAYKIPLPTSRSDYDFVLVVNVHDKYQDKWRFALVPADILKRRKRLEYSEVSIMAETFHREFGQNLNNWSLLPFVKTEGQSDEKNEHVVCEKLIELFEKLIDVFKYLIEQISIR